MLVLLLLPLAAAAARAVIIAATAPMTPELLWPQRNSAGMTEVRMARLRPVMSARQNEAMAELSQLSMVIVWKVSVEYGWCPEENGTISYTL